MRGVVSAGMNSSHKMEIAVRQDRLWLRWAGFGLFGFAALMAIELFSEDSPPEALDLLGDAVETALLVACAVGIAVLASRGGRSQGD